MSRLLRVDEVAERLGLKSSTIRKMIFRRELPVVRPTKRAVRVREKDLEALVRFGYQPARREGR
ncbi:MAG: helix-turn-helix domain-containing protein [candidate division NC10 bacterium]|nr:helix-turn-helix domain-containing protein [candidate division NC10 bacterium]